DLERELRLHLDLARERARPGDEPVRLVKIRVGGIPQAMEAMRDQRGLPWLDDLGRDVRYALRLCRRAPGFTAVAVLALPLGLGANATVFTASKALVARGLDATDRDRLVNLAVARPSGATKFLFSYPDYLAYRDSMHAFSGVLAVMTDRLT